MICWRSAVSRETINCVKKTRVHRHTRGALIVSSFVGQFALSDIDDRLTHLTAVAIITAGSLYSTNISQYFCEKYFAAREIIITSS